MFGTLWNPLRDECYMIWDCHDGDRLRDTKDYLLRVIMVIMM